MTAAAKLFLVTLQRPTGELEVQERDHDAGAAVLALQACERKFADDPAVEVVLLGAESLEALKRTHSSYFAGATAVLGVAV